MKTITIPLQLAERIRKFIELRGYATCQIDLELAEAMRAAEGAPMHEGGAR